MAHKGVPGGYAPVWKLVRVGRTDGKLPMANLANSADCDEQEGAGGVAAGAIILIGGGRR